MDSPRAVRVQRSAGCIVDLSAQGTEAALSVLTEVLDKCSTLRRDYSSGACPHRYCLAMAYCGNAPKGNSDIRKPAPEFGTISLLFLRSFISPALPVGQGRTPVSLYADKESGCFKTVGTVRGDVGRAGLLIGIRRIIGSPDCGGKAVLQGGVRY